ncbi:hypothetical protein [Gemmobacter denitrificans]|uniref:Uncharacterized protein n=1 Tax=Gemmobacter denitrificans TaxID=3123040 RepID=A0ABU8C0N7_9RHOB
MLAVIRLAVNGSREEIARWQAESRSARRAGRGQEHSDHDEDGEAELAADLALLGFREQAE